VVAAAEGVSRIFHHGHAGDRGHVQDRTVHRHAREVHHHQASQPLGQRRFDRIGGQVEGDGVDVKQDRDTAGVDHRGGRGREGPRGHANPAAGSQVQGIEGDLESSGARRHGNHMTHVEQLAHLPLELLALRTGAQPPAAQDASHVVDIGFVDPGKGEADRLRFDRAHHAWPASRAPRNTSITAPWSSEPR